jgi:hypothetical protein
MCSRQVLSKVFSMCFIFAVFIFGMTAGCKSGDPPKPPEPVKPKTLNSVYVGIAAFDREVTPFLLSADLSKAKDFISKQKNLVNSTALCYAVTEAIKMFGTVPGDYDHKFIVTFTDGDDNCSTDKEAYASVPVHYGQEYVYASRELQRRGDIEAWAIGYINENGLMTRENELRTLISPDGEYVRVGPNDNLGEAFQKIARGLKISAKDVVLLTNPGNFTKDNPKYFRITLFPEQADGRKLPEASMDCVLIGKTFSFISAGMSRNIRVDTASIEAERAGNKMRIPLKKLKYYIDGKDENITEIKVQIHTSRERDWREDIEDSTVVEDSGKKVAVMIVLDCTTSLGSKFGEVKEAAKKFIDVLGKNLR